MELQLLTHHKRSPARDVLARPSARRLERGGGARTSRRVVKSGHIFSILLIRQASGLNSEHLVLVSTRPT